MSGSLFYENKSYVFVYLQSLKQTDSLCIMFQSVPVLLRLRPISTSDIEKQNKINK